MSQDVERIVKEFSRTGLSESDVSELERDLQNFRRSDPPTLNRKEGLHHLTPTEAENQPDVGQIISSVSLVSVNASANDIGGYGTGFLAKMSLYNRDYIGFFTAGHVVTEVKRPTELVPTDAIQLHFTKIELNSQSQVTMVPMTELMAKDHVLVCAHQGTKTTIENFAEERKMSCHPDLDFCAVLFTASIESASSFLKEKGLSFLTVAEPGDCRSSPASPVILWGFPIYKKDFPMKLRALAGNEAKRKPGKIPDVAYHVETEKGASGCLVFNLEQKIKAVHTCADVQIENNFFSRFWDTNLASGGISFDTIRAELVRE